MVMTKAAIHVTTGGIYEIWFSEFTENTNNSLKQNDGMKLVENEVWIQVDWRIQVYLDKVNEWDIQKGQGVCNKNTVVMFFGFYHDSWRRAVIYKRSILSTLFSNPILGCHKGTLDQWES